MNWREARLTQPDRTIDDVMHAWRNRDMPESIRLELSRAKLGRLELGKPTRLSPFAKAHLADLLGQRLSAIDPVAADDYNVLTTQASLIATCLSASPVAA